MWMAENERIRHRITDMYADFVKQVDPRSYIVDLLIQRRIVDDEVAEQLRGKETRQERCRAMLHELLISGNPRAFIVLREALIQNYNFIVTRIDEPVTGIYIYVNIFICQLAQTSVWYRLTSVSKSFRKSCEYDDDYILYRITLCANKFICLQFTAKLDSMRHWKQSFNHLFTPHIVST